MATSSKKPRTRSSQLPPMPKEFGQISNYLDRELASDHQAGHDDECSICLLGFWEAGMYDSGGLQPQSVLVSLKECKHSYHESCLKEAVKASPSKDFFQCPKCKKVYGEKIGIQPKQLTMSTNLVPGSLPGFNCSNIIQITYQCRGGIQGPEHPKPGR